MVIFEIEAVKVFLLVMVRFSGLVMAAPLLGSRNFPIMAKVGLVAFCAFLVTPTIGVLEEPLPESPVALAVMASGELLIGVMIGLVLTLVFGAIQVGGQLMDMQSGFGMMNVFNPALETQFPIYGFFLFVIAVLYLLALNGHHMMLKALVSTFDKVPLGGFAYRPELLLEVSRWGSVLYSDGLMIAAPIAGAMFLTYASLGLLGRVVPQIHLFVVGFPLTIAMGLFLVGFALTFYIDILDSMFFDMFQRVETLIDGLA